MGGCSNPNSYHKISVYFTPKLQRISVRFEQHNVNWCILSKCVRGGTGLHLNDYTSHYAFTVFVCFFNFFCYLYNKQQHLKCLSLCYLYTRQKCYTCLFHAKQLLEGSVYLMWQCRCSFDILPLNSCFLIDWTQIKIIKQDREAHLESTSITIALLL